MVVESDDARVGDGDAEYVSRQIAQHGLVTLAPMVDVDDPGLGPGGSGGDQVWALLGKHGLEFAAQQLRSPHARLASSSIPSAFQGIRNKTLPYTSP